MKRLIPVLFVLLAFQGQAQLGLSPDSIAVSASVDTTEFVAGFQVTNNYSSTVSFWWKLIRDTDFPSEWEFQVCDGNTCYFVGVDKCPKNNPNVMTSGMSNGNFSVKIKPKSTSGNSLMYYKFYSDSDCTNEIASLPIQVSVGTVSARNELAKGDITVYPNPTTDKFMLKNVQGISSLEIYNIAGKKMKSIPVSAGREYWVNDLRNGLYVVRFLDKKDKVVKVVRLSKR